MARETADRGNGGGGIPDLVGEITTDAERLIQLNVELAKEEARELAVRNGIAAGLLMAGGLFALLAIFVAVPVSLVLLSGRWWAGPVWAGAYLLLGIILLLVGRALLRLQPPRRTIESLKETKEWVVHQLRSSAR